MTTIGSRNFGEDAQGDLPKVHGAVFPGDIRPGDPVGAHVEVPNWPPGAPQRRALQVWRLSPLGIEVVPDPALHFEPGTRLQLKLRLGHQVSDLQGLVVTSK